MCLNLLAALKFGDFFFTSLAAASISRSTLVCGVP